MTSRIPLPDLLAGLAVLGFGLIGFWQAWAIPVSPLYAQVGPTVIPYVVAAGLTALGASLVGTALRGGWSHRIEELAGTAPPNWRALGFLFAGLVANLILIGPAGFSIAASVQFVLVAAAFGSPSMARDLLIALPLTLLVWFLFVQGLGVNIGAGLLEGIILRMLGQEPV
ncbi:tripartite tricarboxylate transporter TctB family protein [Roseococcus sp.]|uniref:tripartite tricarboxylate transporter TctB family protein n=1 Tax=Roseococcus sp. TaxID=2109646 RepID=UPI003BABA0EB